MADIDLSLYEVISVSEYKQVTRVYNISKYESVRVAEYLEKNEAGFTDPRPAYWPKMPSRSLVAYGNETGSMDVLFPARLLVGNGGGRLIAVAGSRGITATGTDVELGKTYNCKRPTLSAVGYSGGFVDSKIGTRGLYAVGSRAETGSLEVTIPNRTLEATGNADVFGKLDCKFPVREVYSSESFGGVGSLDCKVGQRLLTATAFLSEVGETEDSLYFPVREIEASGMELYGSADIERAPYLITFTLVGSESGGGVEESRFDSEYVLKHNR